MVEMTQFSWRRHPASQGQGQRRSLRGLLMIISRREGLPSGRRRVRGPARRAKRLSPKVKLLISLALAALWSRSAPNQLPLHTSTGGSEDERGLADDN